VAWRHSPKGRAGTRSTASAVGRARRVLQRRYVAPANASPWAVPDLSRWRLAHHHRPGSFDIGSLVASLAAYDRLNEPWQELLDYYSLKEIAVTRYAQIMASVASPNRQD
jgi:hypothetical protein